MPDGGKVDDGMKKDASRVRRMHVRIINGIYQFASEKNMSTITHASGNGIA